jgi:hypothetical protein
LDEKKLKKVAAAGGSLEDQCSGRKLPRNDGSDTMKGNKEDHEGKDEEHESNGEEDHERNWCGENCEHKDFTKLNIVIAWI